jgi:SAM-dependent methyltransferase
MSYSSVPRHRSMALDAVRNAAYAVALRQAVGPDTVVLDLGAGTGIHGLMAARLGARRVYLVEPEDIISVAEEIAVANGLRERVECLQGRIEEVSLPERVDVIVSVLTGNFLVTEDLLQTLFYARDHVLKPGGTLIPSAATMEAVPVSAEALHEDWIASWSSPQHGIDLSAARSYAANSLFYRGDALRHVPMLAEPKVLHTLDFRNASYEPIKIEVAYEITQSGLCHGWAGWSSMKLGDQWLSTSPRAAALHWSHAFLPLDPPMRFTKGDQVTFTLSRAPHGDWTWGVRTPTEKQRHSTLMSVPMAMRTIRQAALDYTPALRQDGRAQHYVLSRCDGARSVQDIVRELRHAFPSRFLSEDEALRFVQAIVRQLA